MENSWWEKFLNLFTEEITEEDPRNYSGRSGRVEEDIRNSDKRSGRIEEIHRGARPRMLSHYPQAKNVKVPMVDDRKGDIRVPQRRRRPKNTEESSGSEQRGAAADKDRGSGRKSKAAGEKSGAQPGNMEKPRTRRNVSWVEETRQPKEKFAGVDFHATEVPSPVYGFRRRQAPVKREEGRMPPEDTNDVRSGTNRANESLENRGEKAEYARDQEQNGHHLDKDREVFPEKGEDHDQSPVGPIGSVGSALEHLYFYGHKDEESSEGGSNEFEDRNISEESEPEKDLAEDIPTGQPGTGNDSVGELDEDDSLLNQEEAPTYEEKQPEDSYIASQAAYEVPDSVPYNVVMFKSDREKDISPTTGQAGYQLPPLELLSAPPRQADGDEEWVAEQRERLSQTLEHFNVKAKVVGVTRGPAVTRFEVQPAPGVKVNKITKLNDDLKLSLAAKDIRIEAPIPGKSSVGIEIPNRTSKPVYLREMIESPAFQNSESPLTAALGLDISGEPIVTDLQKMPHGLIGGATGSGKSVCINSLLISLLYKASPDELRLVLIDPKVVELAPFRDVPHLAAPVINDPKEAALALKWAVEEMERRYERFAEAGARDIGRFNKRAKTEDRMPYIVVVIDELADLMMAAPQDVEESICRIAQKARACGIHLVLATQRPSVDVITGLIKANIPTRLAFSVSAQTDSRTILDMGGAEKLLGHGDMLFVENGAPQSIRVQGNFVSDDEIDAITEFVKKQGMSDYLFEKEELGQGKASEPDTDDELFEDACLFVFEQGSASASSLQRKFRIGYNRASRLIDMMEDLGMISGAMGSKPRELLVSEDEFLEAYTR
ncbi:MAG TPA: DNA translocase FtsK [Bacillales bacterium]